MSSPTAEHDQAIIDREHLKFLAIAYYVLGGVTAAFSCFGLMYVCFGLAMLLFPQAFHGPPNNPNPPPAFFGFFAACFGGLIVLAGWTAGGLIVWAGRSIQLRKRRTFTLVCALLCCLNCMMMPLGVLLAVFTFMVLTRPSVIRMYNA